MPDDPLEAQAQCADRDEHGHVQKQLKRCARACDQLVYAAERPVSAAAGAVAGTPGAAYISALEHAQQWLKTHARELMARLLS